MTERELIIDELTRVLYTMEMALDGLTQDDLSRQPAPDCNSIGWIAWHLTRWQDRSIAKLMKEQQLWIKDGWYVQFGRKPDPDDTGYGHSSEDVAAFKSLDASTLLAYYRAVLERSKHYVARLPEDDLQRELKDTQYEPPLTIALRFILSDGLQHAGQIAYLCGLFTGKGWRQESLKIT